VSIGRSRAGRKTIDRQCFFPHNVKSKGTVTLFIPFHTECVSLCYDVLGKPVALGRDRNGLNGRPAGGRMFVRGWMDKPWAGSVFVASANGYRKQGG
jgi:hypothetical protein